jgi:hypothetical protein
VLKNTATRLGPPRNDLCDGIVAEGITRNDHCLPGHPKQNMIFLLCLLDACDDNLNDTESILV